MLGKWLIGPNWFGACNPSELLFHSFPGWPGDSGRSGLRWPWFPPISMSGCAAIGGCFSAVLQAAGGGLLVMSGKGCLHLTNLNKQRLLQAGGQRNCCQPAAQCTCNTGFSNDRIGGGTTATRHAASLLLSRVASLFLSSSSTTIGFDAVSVAIAYSTAILPPSDDVKACILDNHRHLALDKGFDRERSQGAEGTMVEPRTGTEFPLHLYFQDLEMDGIEPRHNCQVLVGVGVRSKTIVKFRSVDIYAYGLYVQPEHLRAQLGEKYWNVPPEELKFCPEFYEDLLRHEVDMTVRMVVHYKGLKMHMVRSDGMTTSSVVHSAFETSLRNRLRKIKGVPDDNGLHAFCSYLSEDVKLFRGTTIDIQWQPGGQLRTRIEGRLLGTIVSHHLCQAFFDLYIGDPPISLAAKTEMGENFARLLRQRG